jgi:hypothetical protein
MGRIGDLCAAFCAVVVVSLLGYGVAGTASAAASCGETVLDDWSENGRLDRLYSLHCYDDAMTSMPTDLRDYTDAGDVIERGLTAVVRAAPKKMASKPTPDAEAAAQTAGPSALPLPLVLLIGGSLSLVAVGGLSYNTQRRRRVDAGRRVAESTG